MTLYGTPALGERRPGRPNVGADSRARTFAAFAAAVATRYPWVQRWHDLERAEPASLAAPDASPAHLRRPKLLNPAYAAIHACVAGAKVGGWRHGATRLDRRCLPGRLDPRHGRGRGEARRLRAQPLSAQPLRDAVDRRLRPLRDDHDGVARAAAARRRPRVRLGEADLADEYGYQTNPPDRSSASRQHIAGALPRRGGDAGLRGRETSTCSSSTSSRTSRTRRLAERPAAGRTAAPKPSRRAFSVAAAQAYRSGRTTARSGRRFGQAPAGSTTCSSSSAQVRGVRSTAPTGRLRAGFSTATSGPRRDRSFRIVHTSTGPISPTLVVR